MSSHQLHADVVLVVDDDAMMTKNVRRMLSDRTVVGVTEAKNAMAKAEEIKPSLALVDLFMLDGWGIDLVRALRERFPMLAIGLMSGALTHEHTMECIRAGATWFIEKPFDREKLEDAIARGGSPLPAYLELDQTLEQVKRAHIERVLAAHHGNKSAAARALGVRRQTLNYRKKQDRDD
jgi:DNA-binding NtrC family response regulator